MYKPIIYQILPRLWGNLNKNIVSRGSLGTNGTGKFKDIDSKSLDYFKWLGVDYVWYTGIIRHSTKSNEQGCTASHPQFVKGEAGSPYAISNYLDVNPYLAVDPDTRMEEFEDLVKRTHDADLKVIMDFIPNHVARDYSDDYDGVRLGVGDDDSVHRSDNNDFIYYPGEALSLPNSAEFEAEVAALRKRELNRDFKILPAWMVEKARATKEDYNDLLSDLEVYLHPFEELPAKATGNNCYAATPSANDWYETIKLNYGEEYTKTWEKMYNILRFWALKGVDGFRCDMVELVPPQFFTWAIEKIKEEFPRIIFIAEVYKKQLYKSYIREVGFDYLYDKSGLYDCLRNIVEKNTREPESPVGLWQSATGITRNWQFLGDIQPYMLNFLENHDEHRFASEYFAGSASASYAPLAASLYFNSSPFMIYAGQEAGEKALEEEGFSGADGKTTIFDWWSVASLRKLYRFIHSQVDFRDFFTLPQSNRLGDISPDLARELKIAGFSLGEAKFFYRFVNMIRFASSNSAISMGTVYDLNYANNSSEGFDKDKHFAFLRDFEDETLLVVANFSSEKAKFKINIPKHAFEWMDLEMNEELSPELAIEVEVEPMDYIINTLSI